ncbi:MAG: hydrolase [Pirellulales bacterium]
MMDQALAWLASQSSRMADDLTELANLNSWSGNLTGLFQTADWLSAWCDFPSAEFQRIPLSPRRIIDSAGSEQAIESCAALQWRIRPDAPRQVLLGIHFDTVYPPAHEPDQCVRPQPDKLIGPGTSDAKGGIVVVVNALRAVEQFRLAPDCGWTLLLTPDEEIGSPSSASLWESLAVQHDFGLLYEPALSSGAMVAERKGSGSFVIVLRGRSAHAGRDFESGRNAIAMAAKLAVQLDSINNKRSGVTVNVAEIGGGGPVNVVPALAILRFNVRVPDRESQAWFESSLQERLADVPTPDGYCWELHGGFHAPPKTIDDKQRMLMNAIVKCASEVCGKHTHWMAVGGVSDGNRLSAAGLPNIDTLGPIGGNIHSSEEWVDLPSLVEKSQLTAGILAGCSSGRLSLPEAAR